MSESRLKQEAEAAEYADVTTHRDAREREALARAAYWGIRRGLELGAGWSDRFYLGRDVHSGKHVYREEVGPCIRALLEAEAPKEGG
jgi:hypothetical protein